MLLNERNWYYAEAIIIIFFLRIMRLKTFIVFYFYKLSLWNFWNERKRESKRNQYNMHIFLKLILMQIHGYETNTIDFRVNYI